MSDEQYKSDESEVEAHTRRGTTIEPADEDENEVEAHVRKANVRMDSPRKG
jgi:hypothetical protein